MIDLTDALAPMSMSSAGEMSGGGGVGTVHAIHAALMLIAYTVRSSIENKNSNKNKNNNKNKNSNKNNNKNTVTNDR